MKAASLRGVSAKEVDWRFLLPQSSSAPFEHLVLLGGSPAVEQAILDLGVASKVSNTLCTTAPIDAVVGLSGTTASLADASRSLSDNGVIYWEIDRRRPAALAWHPSRVDRQLRRLGLTPAASYWVNRDFSNRLMYVPMDCSQALRWYLDTLFRTPTWPRRLARQALSTAADWCGLSAFAPCYAVTASRSRRQLPGLIAMAAASGIPIPSDARAMFLAYGSTEWNRLVALVFGADSRTPIAAIKVPRTATFNQEIEWEHDVLSQLESQLSEDLAASIPGSRTFRWNALSVSAETCVKGSSLNCLSRPAAEGALNDLQAVVGWLSAFHQHTTLERIPARTWARRHFQRARRDYAATFGETPAEAQMFDRLAAYADALTTETLPIVWQHADLGPPNVYLDHGKVFVIDWETAHRGPALQDLLYFVTDWTAAATGQTRDANREHNFRSLFCDAAAPGTFFHAVHATIADYMRRVGVPDSLHRLILAATFVDKALERSRRLTKLDGCKARGREDNRFVSYLGVLARHYSTLPPARDIIRVSDVSVAIATMNRPGMLARCVESLLVSPAPPGELIIVDQSDDSATAEMVAASRWREVVPLHYIRQARPGLAASRNAAVARASRPVIAFTDDDCVPGDGWIDAIISGFNALPGVDAVTGRVLPLGPERPGYFPVSLRVSTAAAVYRGRALPWLAGTGGNAAFNRASLQRIGGFDEGLGAGSPGLSAEDIDVFYRLLRAGGTVRYEPDAVVYHERQDRQRRRASRRAYGFGIGAFCGQSLRSGDDAYPLWILTRWCADRLRALASSCVRLRRRRAYEECLMLQSAVRGFAYGSLNRRDGRTGDWGHRVVAEEVTR